MSLSHVITKRVATGSRTLEKVVTKTAGGGSSLSESIPDSSTDLEVALTADVSQIKSVWMMATGGNITVETNDGSSPDDTIALVDGEPQMWNDDDIGSLFLTADVTALFVTNSSGAAVTLDVEILIDPTA